MTKENSMISKWHSGNAISALTMGLFVMIFILVTVKFVESRTGFIIGAYGASILLLIGAFMVLVTRSKLGSLILSIGWVINLVLYASSSFVLAQSVVSQNGKLGALIFLHLMLLWSLIGSVIALIGFTHKAEMKEDSSDA